MTILFQNLQISRSDIRPHIKWAVSLVIACGHFNLPPGFFCTCIGQHIHFISSEGGLHSWTMHVWDSWCDRYFAVKRSVEVCNITFSNPYSQPWEVELFLHMQVGFFLFSSLIPWLSTLFVSGWHCSQHTLPGVFHSHGSNLLKIYSVSCSATCSTVCEIHHFKWAFSSTPLFCRLCARYGQCSLPNTKLSHSPK